eukprot:TRINITY_DN111723_c0_g1_i1.p1 TRINITY_DN111723_c0_g1~~TRINITY_DN111723_c0_g1_i1.p1  ORF type:complete len:764 (+),score=124.79 TRINITY_DN111723_c0_g1_i1:202-2493(+)
MIFVGQGGRGPALPQDMELRETEHSFASVSRANSDIHTLGPQTHGLPSYLMWVISISTAVIMAVINFCSLWVISFVVEFKFEKMQEAIDAHSTVWGIFVLVGICGSLASVGVFVVFCIAPGAGGSGAPENKGFLNGNDIPGLFTGTNLVCRACATMLANTAGFPVGREGPTVTMGSNLAFLITEKLALPHVKQWVKMDAVNFGAGCTAAKILDEERLAHAKRVVCTVGGACGMAMLFDSPVGGIIYMFEEITSSSWPMEVTIRAFAATTACALISRALLNACGTTTKAFVIYEFDPMPQPWTWTDVPFFILVAAVVGPFSVLHTKLCLAVGACRQQFFNKLRGTTQTVLKVLDTLLFATFCASSYACVALLAKCESTAGVDPNAIQFVRYNCPIGEYNPVASLLLTTSEGAVKRLFSRRNSNELHPHNELMAFCVYTTLNICLTGVPVPSGNFTGSMLIGGLIGRIVGGLARGYGPEGVALSGIYSMVGSAAMLCGFKQMCIAVVIFIAGCADDFDLLPPLMLTVVVALLLNKCISEMIMMKGFDEEQITRKKIPFLNPETPHFLDNMIAEDLADPLPPGATLPVDAPVAAVKQALQLKDIEDFPVIKHGNICIGFTTRSRLAAALLARKIKDDGTVDESQPGQRSPSRLNSVRSDEISLLLSADVGRVSSEVGGIDALMPVGRLADKVPYTMMHTMPAPRAYGMFAKAGIRAAALVTEEGKFRTMITRRGLILTARRLEEDFEKGQHVKMPAGVAEELHRLV